MNIIQKVINNDTDSLKNFLHEYGIENVIAVKHINNFVFEAITPSSFVKIITEPFDDEQKHIKILSINTILVKFPIPSEEQELLVYLAKYKHENMLNFFNTNLCKKQYPPKDIEDFKSIIDLSISNDSAIQKYWNLDTAARDYFMEIIQKVFYTQF